MFALSASLVFLGIEMDVWGEIGDTGLELHVDRSAGTPELPIVPHLKLEEDFDFIINANQFSAKTTLTIELDLEIPQIDIFGHDLGGCKLDVVDMTDTLSLNVTYGESMGKQQGFEFTMGINLTAFGVHLSETMTLDADLQDIRDLPDVVKAYVEHRIVEELQKTFDITSDLKKGIAFLDQGLNLAGHEIAGLLSEAGHVSQILSPSRLYSPLHHDLVLIKDFSVGTLYYCAILYVRAEHGYRRISRMLC